MNKIVIFGATGNTGLCVLEAALKKGIEVRAFVRDPAKLPVDLRDKVDVVVGNVLEPDSVMTAVEGVDGVVIALGTRDSLEPTYDMSEGTGNILEAMRAKNVKVLSICLSAFLIYDTAKIPPRFLDITEEHKRMFDAVKDCGLNWIAVLPPHIANEPSTEYIIKVNPEKTPGRKISKYDLGQFLLDSMDEPKYYKCWIGLTDKNSLV